MSGPVGRDGGIRTRDLSVPNAARYQAALRPDAQHSTPVVSGSRLDFAQARAINMRHLVLSPKVLLRPLAVAAIAALALGAGAAAFAEGETVDVISVEGTIDASFETAIANGIRTAESDGAPAVVLRIDSRGALSTARTRRIVANILAAKVPVIAWIGPPGAEARNSAALIAVASNVVAMAPGTALGPVATTDLRATVRPTQVQLRRIAEARSRDLSGLRSGALSADAAERSGLVDMVAIELPDVLRQANGTSVTTAAGRRTLSTDPSELSIRFRKNGFIGRFFHAVAQPSMTYILLLAGLIAVVFELFHPNSGPSGVSGLVAIGLATYGVANGHGSWVGMALIILGTLGFCIDLRVEGFGLFTLLGVIGLVSGSLLLFHGPYLHVNQLVMAFGIAGFTSFMIAAMTRVLRDLRALARGEIEVTDPHPH